MNRFICILLATLITSAAFAGTGYSFLEIPVGARESALGGSGVALISGATSAAHNPAAIALAKSNSFVLMANRHFGDARAQFFGVNFVGSRWAVSPHYWGTRVPDVEFRTDPTRQPISEFDAINSALGGAVARKITNDFAVGVTGHYLYQKIHVESSDGWAVDAGAFWQTPLAGLALGVAVNHLGSVSEFISEEVELPTTVRGGTAFSQPISNLGTLLLTAEGAGVSENTPVFRGGIEFRAREFVALRGGYVEGLDAQGVSLGFGLFHRGINVDYAFIPFKEELGEGHRFSLGLEF